MNTWVLITQNNCDYCTRAMALMALNNVKPEIYNCSHSPIIKAMLKDMGIMTVPQVFHMGQRIGGYRELEEYLNDKG